MTLEEYKKYTVSALNELYTTIQNTEELKRVINQSWLTRMLDEVGSWQVRYFTIGDKGFHLYDILDKNNTTPRSINPLELERRLQFIAKLARSQQISSSYTSTLKSLKERDAKNIIAAIFEVNVLSSLIECGIQVELYPNVGDGNKDVEARVSLANRWIYIEAKAITFSPRDEEEGSVSVHQMMLQVKSSLDAKLGENKQLSLVEQYHPTVLCLSLGNYANHLTAKFEIERYFLLEGTNVSMVILFDSAFCNYFQFFENTNSTKPLTEDERQHLESCLRKSNRPRSA